MQLWFPAQDILIFQLIFLKAEKERKIKNDTPAAAPSLSSDKISAHLPIIIRSTSINFAEFMKDEKERITLKRSSCSLTDKEYNTCASLNISHTEGQPAGDPMWNKIAQCFCLLHKINRPAYFIRVEGQNEHRNDVKLAKPLRVRTV